VQPSGDTAASGNHPPPPLAEERLDLRRALMSCGTVRQVTVPLAEWLAASSTGPSLRASPTSSPPAGLPGRQWCPAHRAVFPGWSQRQGHRDHPLFGGRQTSTSESSNPARQIRRDDPPVTTAEEGGPGEDTSSPGILADWIAPTIVAQMGADARLSSANVRLPAAAQATTTTPIRA